MNFGLRNYFGLRISLFGFFLTALVFLSTIDNSRAGFVYESQTEFFTSGDFNGDGILDVLVLDKSTGNARVGYQNSFGELTWSEPMTTGVQNISGCAVGNFLQEDRDALAVTALDFNSVPLIDLSNTNSASSIFSIGPLGIGAHSLASLARPTIPPQGTLDSLFIASALNDQPNEKVEVAEIFPGPLISSIGTFDETGLFERANELEFATNGPTFAAGMVRGQTNDALHVWQFTNAPSVAISLSNLPSDSDYVFGKFDNEVLPRFWFYVPGESNVTIRPLIANGDGFEFGTAMPLTFTQGVERIYYSRDDADGSAFIQFGDGIQGVRLSGGVPQFAPKYQTGGGAAGNSFTGFVELENGKFALFSAPDGAGSSVHAQVMTFDGTNYTQISSNNLPSVSTGQTRATVWLFQNEPFVNPAAFISSLNAPDWSSGSAVGSPGSLTVRVENDGGTSAGLGSATTNNVTIPSTATYALPDQYRDDISFFSYTPPRAPDSALITISPPPGSYGGPIQISFTKQPAFYNVFYRTSANDDWKFYSAPFTLTNDSAIQYYGRVSNSPRGRVQVASYTVGHTNLPPEQPLELPDGSTNQPPNPTLPGTIISSSGTIFYGRGDFTIWAINLDGSGDQLVTTNGYNPRVSPDGHYMLFSRFGVGTFLRDMLTGVETQIHSPDSTTCYDWERNSTNFVVDFDCGIFSSDLAGNYTPLPPGDCDDDAPVVNPIDGSLAFYNSSVNAGIRGIYVMPPSRTNRIRLNLSLTNAGWPSWSRDGKSLAVRAGNPFAENPDESPNNLWLLNADGSNLRQITALENPDGLFFGAIWSPDDRALVTAGNIWGTNGLWVLHLSPDGQYCGCAPVRLPTTEGAAIAFAGSVIVPPGSEVIFQPGLFVREEAEDVVIFWSVDYAGYTLEWTADLGANNWTEVPGPYSLNGFYYEHREPKAALQTRRFFRLHSAGIITQP